jgi:[FeFe] hydrogenase H-cluster maturation GTPase HydF
MLSKTPTSERIHIAFFGCRNAGKSSLVNALTNQNLSLVSDIKGTTTDPVSKSMEILPLGPVVIIDTAGIDDSGVLGQMRVEKSEEILRKTNIAILVVDASLGMNEYDKNLIQKFNNMKIPYIIAYNKSDIIEKKTDLKENEIYVSAKNKYNIEELKNKISKIANESEKKSVLICDKLKKNDIVVLVIPIDESAPKGRLILPQQLVLRELLDNNIIAVCLQDTELEAYLSKNPNINLVITDSQAFSKVNSILPENIPLTSFSIIMARYKGNLDSLLKGANAIQKLKEGDYVLIAEACTHHRQCNDIGTVKIPKLLKKYTGLNLNYEFSSGYSFPADLKKYSLVIHCGGCMINENEMKARISQVEEAGIPIVNYGMAIAYMNGILDRSIKILR